MQFTTEEEKDLTLPEDSIHRARLEEIKLRTYEFTKDGETKEAQKLEWWWEITSTRMGPDYIGRKVKGECHPRLTNRPDNQFRNWAEALLGRSIPVGMGLDTDDLIGLEADIAIGHRADRKNPDKKWEFVSGVITADGYSQDSEPPF